MLYQIPEDITAYLATLDAFIEREIKPIEAGDDNIRFFDHRREDARTDWDREGLPTTPHWAGLRDPNRSAHPRAGDQRTGYCRRAPQSA